MRSFCQDRLGTNIGKTQKRVAFFLSRRAPELWLADECDGHKLDMWACGLMLYQLVAGTLPFDDIDFEQELDPQRLMFLSETISNFGSAAGSAAGPPLPAGCGELSAPLRQLLAGLLQPAPYRRMTAAQALEEPWCHAECSVADSQLKEAGYTASAATVRAVVEAGLGTEDPDRWAGRQPGQTPSPQQQQRQSLVPATPEEQPQPQQEKEKEKEKEGEGEEVERAEVDELDAVQAEIAKLKAEMGL
jgi:serine/threonine protein kinase